MAVTSIISFFASLVFTVMLGFALSSNYWIGFVFDGKSYHSGLWNACEKKQKCLEYAKWKSEEMSPVWLKQVRVLYVIGCISSVICILISMLRLFNNKIKTYTSAIFYFITAALVGGACWLYARRNGYYNAHALEEIEYKWGFILACTSACFALVLSIFSFVSYLATCRKSEDDVNYGFVSHV